MRIGEASSTVQRRVQSNRVRIYDGPSPFLLGVGLMALLRDSSLDSLEYLEGKT